MRKILVGCLTLAAAWACDTTEAKQATIDTPTLQCAQCQTTVKRVVENVDGVRGVSVDLEAKQVRVSYDDGSTWPEALAAAIVSAGYDANGIAADSTAYASLPECCRISSDQAHH